MKIDIVSDVVCPWCYIGKRRLERALATLRKSEPALDVTLRWHPFFDSAYSGGGFTLGSLALASVASMAFAMGWLTWSPFHTLSGLNVNSVIEFLNRGGHDRYRYLTLGFGNALPKVSTYTDASSVDGEYNSARLLPEMTHYGSAQLTSSKFFGTAGMESLRAMLKHANNYGLK